MNPTTKISSSYGSFCHAHIVSVDDAGAVCNFDDSGETLPCFLLDNGSGLHLTLSPGDDVIAVQPVEENCPGIIIGRIVDPQKPVPDVLVIKAGRELTLKCGEASIQLFADGTIRIDGKDVESRASRVNRIKGNSVTLN